MPVTGRWRRSAAGCGTRGILCNRFLDPAFRIEHELRLGDDGFAVIRLQGNHLVLREFATWRATEEQRFHHELTTGDLNSDGFVNVTDLLIMLGAWSD